MVTAQRTLAINAAFLQEIKDDNRELRSLLEQSAVLLNRPRQLGGRFATCGSKCSARCATRCAAPRLEEAYGYFRRGDRRRPRDQADQAESLRSEHPKLYLSDFRIGGASRANHSMANRQQEGNRQVWQMDLPTSASESQHHGRARADADCSDS